MKTRLYKSEFTRALLWYQDRLYEKHMNQLLTPARVELIRRDLAALQTHQLKRETNVVWKVPVEIVVELEKNIFFVQPSDESQLLYLHEENV